MPEQIKNNPDSKEFHQYLQGFIQKKERQHRKKVMREIATSLALMFAS